VANEELGQLRGSLVFIEGFLLRNSFRIHRDDLGDAGAIDEYLNLTAGRMDDEAVVLHADAYSIAESASELVLG
jgi:hypothetical protein